jgi:hypothetical protein
MAETSQTKFSFKSILEWFGTTLGQIIVAVIVPVITGYVMVKGFIFLRDGEAPKYVIALVAIIWRVGGVALIYYITNWLLEKLPPKRTALRKRIICSSLNKKRVPNGALFYVVFNTSQIP